MEINLSGTIIIAGNYGSGKSETAVNLAATGRARGLSVKITDLDLVNPYFRSREARQPLEDLGVDVVLPDPKYMHADLPILTPAVAGIIQAPAELTILDAGGDDVGVTVLAALADVFKGRDIQMLQVINPLRPFTETLDGCLTIKKEIEESSKLKVTGLVSNANLIDETTPEIIYDGYDLVRRVSDATGLDIAFITASTRLMPRLDTARFTCPVLPIDRKLAPPWKRI
ncbi:MAG: division plane positioning ATPase MipZ [Desulfobacterales bacterium]|nr:division plane positioning ATPase MipZ [Desulfobacterales bacterium]